MNYRAVFIDLDGTLLNNQHMITDYTRDILRSAKKAGIHIVINSGRVVSEAKEIFRQIKEPFPFISANGAYIKASTDANNEENTILNTLSFETLREAKEVFDNNDACLHLFTSDCVYIDESVKKYYKNVDQRPFCNLVSKEALNELIENHSERFLKGAVLCVNEMQARKVREQLESLRCFEVIYSGRNFIEFNSKGVTKGSGMLAYLKKYNIPKEAAIAIGDHENDISMIENAGLGVAMGNAIGLVKQKADYITLSNDQEGVAKVILRYVLS